MPTRNTKFYSIILILADTVTLLVAFTLAYVLRVQFDNRPLLDQVYAYEYINAFLVITPVWIIVFALLGLYRSSVYLRRLTEWAYIVAGAFIGILLIIGWEYVSDNHIFPARLSAVYAFVGATLLVIFERELIGIIKRQMYRFGYGVSRVLIIGDSSATRDIALQMSDTARSGYQVIAFAGPKALFPEQLHAKHYSHIEGALKDIEILNITTIIQTDLYDSTRRNELILSASQVHHINYNFIPGEAEFYAGKNTVDVFLGYPMISVSQTPLIGWGAVAKRIFDTIMSVVALIVLSPFLLLLVLLQIICNPGPVFYISKRLSQFSKPIQLVKFRSMGRKYGKKDAAEEFEEMGRDDLAKEYRTHHKVTNDPRITWFGRFLRATSLDELPQLINVLKGDLSLVGPRPILPQEVNFSKHRTALLHSVKSGVTGLWQVSGRSNLSFEERIELELFYARNWSFWLDIKILFKTVAVVLFGKGAK